MTVAELIKELSKMPQDKCITFEVFSEDNSEWEERDYAEIEDRGNRVVLHVEW